MAIITLLDAQLAFGHTPLLDRAEFALESNERIGLIGRNGTGKSTFLKVLARQEKLDSGHIHFQNHTRIEYVPQEPVFDSHSTVYSTVSEGLAHITTLIESYTSGTGNLDLLQTQIEALNGWNYAQRIAEILQRLALSPDALIHSLSGGTKKKVALARALVASPHVLLLDEPTNHLDVESILWLENLLLGFSGSLITITHDRSFLNNIATRIIELDRGTLKSYPGNFSHYQQIKEDQLQQEAVINAKSDKLLAQEEVWIRKGVEARRTRAQGRIVRLEKLREQRQQRRDLVGKVKLEIDKGLSTGKLVAELFQVNKSFNGRQVIQNFSTTILRGDKIGIIGPNGAGKSTLLKLILGEIQPDDPHHSGATSNALQLAPGTIKLGTHLNIAYFDQLRNTIDDTQTLADFISPGSEWIEIGKKRQHVNGYLTDFLFSPSRANAPVQCLSGGERNRLLLARLFARPANVLVLDEPTNDLDIETLELLEDLLHHYDGTVLLVSHDRTFLDQVVTSTIVHQGQGLWTEFEGGIQDWHDQSQRFQKANATVPSVKSSQQPTARSTESEKSSQPLKKRKLSYKEQRELEALPLTIEALEKEQAQLQALLADGQLFVTDNPKAVAVVARCSAIDEELIHALERWESLDS
jgi:ABC transport system ATP-binding/permease protein